MDTLVFQLKKIPSKGLVKQLSTLIILKILLLLRMIIGSKFQESWCIFQQCISKSHEEKEMANVIIFTNFRFIVSTAYVF